ncbi:MAG: hypothetical protein K1X68_13955 [Saprospiraceae bacterium]|nr:hypothetical protein [Saprospiraceae bacterium]HNG70187.1 MG2 domain-containing protein [Saprospiraceae bacterium]HNL19666.1 MG2 domain-containing protein [Saprospiraceae bacterium]
MRLPRIIVCYIIILLSLGSLYGQYNSRYEINSKNPLWLQYDSLIRQKHFKQAKSRIQSILDESIQSNNCSEGIMSLEILGAINSKNNKYKSISLIQTIESSLPKLNGCFLALAQSILAELYAELGQESECHFEGYSNDSLGLLTYSQSRIMEISSKYYMKSISNDTTQSINIGYLRNLFTLGIDTIVRPTVYDLLIYRALAFFTSHQNEFIEPELSPESAFTEIDDFLKSDFSHDIINELYQRIMKLNISRNNLIGLIDANIYRLKTALNRNNDEFYQMKYYNLLVGLYNQYKETAVAGNILFELGDLFSESSYSNLNKLHKSNIIADSIFNLILNNYPNCLRRDETLLGLNRIHAKQLEFKIEKINTPNRNFKFLLSYRNINTVKISIYKLTQRKYEKIEDKNWQDNLSSCCMDSSIKCWIDTLILPTDFKTHSTELKIDSLPIGFYYILVSSKTDSAGIELTYGSKFQISNIAVTVMKNDWISKSLVALDRESGKPISNAIFVFQCEKPRCFSKNDTCYFLDTVNSDDKGKCNVPIYKDRQISKVYVYSGNDTSINSLHLYNRNNELSDVTDKVLIFTDRNIYRPGQNVFFKIVTVRYDTFGIPSIIKNRPIEVSIRSSNNNTHLIRLMTNEMGSAHGSFLIPMDSWTGIQTLVAEDDNETIDSLEELKENSTDQVQEEEEEEEEEEDYDFEGYSYFRIEEYRKPGIEILIDSLQGDLLLGEDNVISGKIQRYNGTPLINANIECIIYSPSNLISRFYNQSDRLEQSSEDYKYYNIKTDLHGRFKIHFIPKNEEIYSNYSIVRTYLINLNVTSINGESERKTIELNIANKREIITSDIKPSYSSNENINITYTSKNISGNLVKSDKIITVYQQSIPQGDLRNRLWQKPEFQKYNLAQYREYFPDDVYMDENNRESWKLINIIFFKEIKHKSSYTLQLSNLCKPGAYKIITESNINGNKIEKKEEYFIVYDEKENPYFEPLILNNNLEPNLNKPIQLTLMKTKNPYMILYNFECRTKMKADALYSDSLKNYIFKINEKDGGGAYFTGICIYRNRSYKFEYYYPVSWSEKKLKLSELNYKRNLTPGSSAKWNFSLERKVHNHNDVEILASMYDASLDHFSNFNWDTAIWTNYEKKYTFTLEGFESSSSKYISGYYSNPRIHYPSSTNLIAFYDNVPNCPVEYCVFKADKTLTSFDEARPDTNDYFAIRRNWNETAFFLPDIKLNKNNKFNIKFMAPESYTRWKTQIFAYDKNLNYAYKILQSTTKKTLEIKPFYPRVLREGDSIKIKVSLTNNGNFKDKGILRFEFDTIDVQDKGIKSAFEDQIIYFTIDAFETKIYSWSIVVPYVKTSKLKFKFLAQGRNNDDGEEKEVPLISNKKELIESFPLNISANETKKFEFTSMKKITNDSIVIPIKYKFEYTLNPLLYVIQSIPFLIFHSNECSDQIVTSFFGYAMIDKIVSDFPKYKNLLEFSYNQNTPRSSLIRNSDVKNINLSNTPWTPIAQMENIDQYNEFIHTDSISIQRNFNFLLNRLIPSVSNDNGVSWLPGMTSNRWLSQRMINIVYKLVKLHPKLNVYINYNSTFNKLKLFLANQIKNDYLFIQNMRENNINYHVTSDRLELSLLYLYGKTMYSTNIKDSILECAEKYFLQQAIKFNGDESYYLSGIRALVLERNGYHHEAKKILELLKEESIESEEMGTYWEILQSASFNTGAIETQSILIEAFAEIDSSSIVSHMIDWLIKNKQSNHWGSENATVDAMYCILKFGDNTESKVDLPSITIGKNTILSENKNTQPPYISKTWEGSEIDSTLANITIMNAPNSKSWGAAYLVYSKDINEIRNSSETNLKLEKLFFLNKRINNKDEIIPLRPTDTIRLGDKITTQIKISTDRPMDFVQMKIMHCTGFEATNQLSGIQWTNSVNYYASPKDSETDFFFDHIKPGSYSVNLEFTASFQGNFTDGIGVIQSMYAPEFSAHTFCRKIVIK